MYHLQLNLLVQLDPQCLWLNHPRMKKKVDFSISHYARETTTEEHQATKKESLTTQPKDRQKARTTVGTAMTLHDPGSCNCAVLYCTLYQ